MDWWTQSKRIVLGILVLSVLATAAPVWAQSHATEEMEVVVTEVARPDEPRQQIWAVARGGIGTFTETHLDQQAGMGFGGIRGVWLPAETTRVTADFSVMTYERLFQPLGMGSAGHLPQVEKRETEFEGSATCGFNFLYFTPVDFWAYAGWRHVFFMNDGFDEHFSGGVVGLQLEVPIVDILGFHVFGDHTFNLLSLNDKENQLGDSIVGSPEASMRFGGGFRFFPGDFVELGLAYEGNWMPFEYSDLLIHQLVFEAGFIFRI